MGPTATYILFFDNRSAAADAISQYRFYCCKVLSSRCCYSTDLLTLSFHKQCFKADIYLEKLILLLQYKAKINRSTWIDHWYYVLQLHIYIYR